MFNLAQRNNNQSFTENMHALHIVPVAISYELDPCDRNKARELYEKDLSGAYQKAEDEDMKSIVEGIEGFKGEIHIAFGAPLITQAFQNANDVAIVVNQHIHQHYKLFAMNFFAWEAIKEEMLEQQPELACIPAISTIFTEAELTENGHILSTTLCNAPKPTARGYYACMPSRLLTITAASYAYDDISQVTAPRPIRLGEDLRRFC